MIGLAFIALGSNLGDSQDIVLRAMDRLGELSVEPLLRSSLWRTAPVDCPLDSPSFVNAMVGLTPRRGETPETLLAKLQAIEREFGRATRKVINEPRSLDLDLIVFGSEIRTEEQLKLPHPRAHQRAFVLAPLSEIAPDYVIPLQSKTVRELLAQVELAQDVSQLQRG